MTIVILLTLGMEVVAQNHTAKVPEGVRVYPDLPYVSSGHERQKLDLYVPSEVNESLPLLVWIHGGGWMMGSRKDAGQFLSLAGGGYIVASLDYRLSQDAVFPAQIEDCKAAIRWLRAHAQQYGIDPVRIGVGGSSAGGHLAALLGTSGGVTEFEAVGDNADMSSSVQAVLDLYGPSDFTQMGGWHDAPDSPESRLIGGTVQESKDKAAEANPITYISQDDPPFLVLHGTEDDLVPFNQSELLVAALNNVGVDVTFRPIPGAGHGGPEFETEEIRDLITAFFDEHLQK